MGQGSVSLRAVRSDVLVGAQAVGSLRILFHTRNVIPATQAAVSGSGWNKRAVMASTVPSHGAHRALPIGA